MIIKDCKFFANDDTTWVNDDTMWVQEAIDRGHVLSNLNLHFNRTVYSGTNGGGLERCVITSTAFPIMDLK